MTTPQDGTPQDPGAWTPPPTPPPAPPSPPGQQPPAGGYPPPQQGWAPPPAYGSPDYNAPGYNAPGYGAPGYGTPGGYVPPTPPPRNRRTWLWITIAAAVVIVAVLVIVGVAAGGGDDGNGNGGGPSADRSITLPSSFDGYAHQTGTIGQETAAAFKHSLTGSNATAADLAKAARIGIYSRSSTPELIFLGVSSSSNATARSFLAKDKTDLTRAFLSGTGASAVKSYDSGKFGGDLRCGAVDEAGLSAVCIWADESTLGVTIRLGSSTPAQLAALTLDLRNAAEH